MPEGRGFRRIKFLMSSMINEKKLFSLISNFFAHPDNVIYELAQNAVRSKATKMEITYKNNPNQLTVKDNGKGTKNYRSLLILAESDWDKDVENSQMPAGWGNYYLIALSKSITYKSLFGSLTIDCPRFLNDTEYRENIFSLVNKSDSCDGFSINAELLPNVNLHINSDNLSFFPIDITLNNKLIKKTNIKTFLSEYNIQTKYQSNHLGIKIRDDLNLDSLEKFAEMLSVSWYGIPINFIPALHNAKSIFLNVTKGTPVTPTLPYRHSIKNDEKISLLYEFAKTEVIKYCISVVNNHKVNNDIWLFRDACKILSKYASQDELDSLPRFYAKKIEPYYNTELNAHPYQNAIIEKGTTIVNENVKVYIDGKEIDDYDNLFLPEGTITNTIVFDRHPSWLKVKNKTYVVNISTTGNKYSGYYEWERSTISCKGKDIKTLALIASPSNGCVYYTETPTDFYEIQDAVFAQREYYSDGDTYDSQENYFNKEISRDIQNITGVYNISDIFNSFYDVLNINPCNILSLSFDKNKKEIVIKEKNTDSQNTEIKERILKVA